MNTDKIVELSKQLAQKSNTNIKQVQLLLEFTLALLIKEESPELMQELLKEVSQVDLSRLDITV